MDIDLGKPPARLDELNNIDELLGKHDGGANGGKDPRDGRVELVSARHFEGACRKRIREELLKDGRVYRLARGAASGLCALDEVRGEQRGGEGEQI